MPQIDNDSLALAIKEHGVTAVGGADLISTFGPFWQEAVPLAKAAYEINITDASQTKEIRAAAEIRKQLADVRIRADKIRKELKDNALRECKAVDGVAGVIPMLTKPAEEHLKAQEQFAILAEQKRRADLIAIRTAALIPYGIDTTYYSLDAMAPEKFDQLLEQAKTSHEAKLAAEKKAEEDRIAAEQAALAEQERIRQENEILRAKQAEVDAKIKAEREAAEAITREAEAKAAAERAKHEAELKAERDKAEAAAKEVERKAREEREAAEKKAAAERAAHEAEIQKEREAREKLQREAQARADADAAKALAEKAAAAAKLKAEQEAARIKAMAPDKDKLRGVAQQVREIVFPEVNDSAAKAVRDNIAAKAASFAVWIEAQIDTLQ